MDQGFTSLPVSVIRSNSLLAATLAPTDVQRWAELFKLHGLLAPVVVRPDKDGGYMVVVGQPELEAVRQLQIRQTDAIVVDCGEETEAHKLSLRLLSLRNCSNHLEEALIIQAILKDPKVSQTDLAKMCGRSLSWVTKRMSLVSSLTPQVVDLVARKQLPPATAQEIAKLPAAVQHRFAMRVVEDKIPKSVVERLISLYNSKNASEQARRQILASPASALSELAKEAKKLANEPKRADDRRLEKGYRLLAQLLDRLLDLLTAAQFPAEIVAALEERVGRFLDKLHECQQHFPQGKEDAA
jgi:ParB/RepB/Spo0J family partition protein